MTESSVRVESTIGRVAASLAVLIAMLAPSGVSATETTPAAKRAASAGIGLRLVDVPSAAQSDPRARIYIVDHLAPGRVIHRRIEVSNSTSATLHVALYAAAATIANGSFLGSAGSTPNELSAWTSVSPRASEVPAHQSITAGVTIAVPLDAAPGERYGVVWAETSAAPQAGSGITQVSRVGIRLYVAIGAGGAAAADFAIDSLTAVRSHSGAPVVVASVHNTGGRALDMSGSLRLENHRAHLNAGPFPATLGVTLAIGDREPVTIALDEQLPAGPWNAQITLRSGLIERSARATITFPRTGESRAVRARQIPSPLPGIGAVGVFVVTLSGAAWAGTRTIRRRRRIRVFRFSRKCRRRA